MANDFKIKNGLQLGGAFVEKVGTISGNADVDLSTGNVFDYTPTADATFTFSNAGETEHSFVLSVVGANVSTSYDLANASYDSVSFSIAGQSTSPLSIFFKPDGTKMYFGGVNFIYEYALSTAWDISASSYVQSLSVAALSFPEEFPVGISFKPDGTKMYVLGQNSRAVNEYSLSTAWDVSTASYTQKFSISAQEFFPSDLFFKPDGTKMYITGSSGDDVNEYDLSTAWDVSSASYTQSFSVAAQESSPLGLYFSTAGTEMFVTGNAGIDVNEYSLSTAWDVSTASYVQNFSVAAQETNPTSLSFKSDGTKLYIIGSETDTIYQYSTAGTPAPATFTYPASVAWPSGTAPDAPADGETDILEFSTTDGGTVWYGLRAGDAMA